MPRSKSAGNADSKPGDPNQSESLCRETMNDVPAGFLPLSSATNRLADGMWAVCRVQIWWRPSNETRRNYHLGLALGGRSQDGASGPQP